MALGSLFGLPQSEIQVFTGEDARIEAERFQREDAIAGSPSLPPRQPADNAESFSNDSSGSSLVSRYFEGNPVTRQPITTNFTGSITGSQQRLWNSLLPAGGSVARSFLDRGVSGIAQATVQSREAEDWRVRLSLAPGLTGHFYRDNSNAIMSPLLQTDGMIFPYTPSINIVHSAQYSQQQMTHSNYVQHFYSGSSVEAITISGDFTCQDVNDGQYVLASIYFLRAVTKMFYGQDNIRGTPPPVLRLNGYGSHILPSIPVVVTTFSMDWQPNVDYMEVPVSQEVVSSSNFPRGRSAFSSVRIPTEFTIATTMYPMYSRNAVSNEFSLKEFSKGNMLNTATRGGFI
tara:strand:+ start:66 stop:1100 length:1035 start_codon:yes stop_codon:yes gene_type:complete